jgi:uncharacterized protein (DUF924 family)
MSLSASWQADGWCARGVETVAMSHPTWVGDVLRFWFEECVPEQWFKKDDTFDQALRSRFAEAHRCVTELAQEKCLADADTALAATIVLDQFSRNMFRGTPAAFGSDAKALGIAEVAVSRGFDQHVSETRRQFFYLPFEHAEDAAVQDRSVALFAKLGPEALRWANAHKVIIDRFGRFPHRNAILGRVSTPEEIEFLAGPGSSF